MLALGCIQALECNTNHCPTGVATQDKELVAGLNVNNKKQRVANYHRETINSLIELMAAGGIRDPKDIGRHQIYRRNNINEISSLAQIYPVMKLGALLDISTAPESFKVYLDMADAESFAPKLA